MRKPGGFLDAIDDVFLTQHVMENTRVRGQDNPRCLYLILTESEDSANSVEYYYPLGSSDHCILTWNYVVSVGFGMRSPRRKCYHREDYTKMKEMLRDIRWGEEITGSTISERLCLELRRSAYRMEKAETGKQNRLGSMEKLEYQSEESSLLT